MCRQMPLQADDAAFTPMPLQADDAAFSTKGHTLLEYGRKRTRGINDNAGGVIKQSNML